MRMLINPPISVSNLFDLSVIRIASGLYDPRVGGVTQMLSLHGPRKNAAAMKSLARVLVETALVLSETQRKTIDLRRIADYVETIAFMVRKEYKKTLTPGWRSRSLLIRRVCPLRPLWGLSMKETSSSTNPRS